MKVFNSFRSAFREFKAKLSNYFETVNYAIIDDPRFDLDKDEELKDIGAKKKKKQRETKPNTWEFQEELIFIWIELCC